MRAVLHRIAIVAAFAASAASTAFARGKSAAPETHPAVVLVHGAFVDGSGWEKVYGILTRHGYAVTVVQNPTTSLADDVAATKRALAAQPGPVILVGHSYGGMVISEAGNDPKVASLVYVAAYVPDQGESLQTLLAAAPPDAAPVPILAPVEGFLSLDREKFAASFAADVKPAQANFLASSQVPCGVQAVGSPITTPAWRAKPSFYLVTKNDRMISPTQQRQMAKRAGATVADVESSHAVMLSKPDAVAALIERAAAAVSTK
jgi:pimeloyl-ACP methyl ester carboxylesterase